MVFAYDKRTFAKRLFVMLFCVALYRFFACLQLPFVNEEYSLVNNSTESIMALLTAGTQTLSFAALGISPYISASIMMQFLSALVPSISDMQKGGETGQKVIKRVTLYISFVMAIISGGWYVTMHDSGFNFASISEFIIVWGIVSLVPCIFACISYKMDDTAYGDGVSLFLAAGIVSSFPRFIVSAFEAGKDGVMYSFWPILLSFLGMVFVFFLTCHAMKCRYAVPLSYSQKMPEGNFKEDTLSIRLLSNGVMPVIFATLVFQLLGQLSSKLDLFFMFHMNMWFNGYAWWINMGIFVYFLLIWLFTRVMRFVSFNEREVSESLRKSSCVIPNVAPGIKTTRFLKKSFRKLNFIDSLMLCVITILPLALSAYINSNIVFPSGASIVLLVSVSRVFFDARHADNKSKQYHEVYYKLNSNDKFALFNEVVKR